MRNHFVALFLVFHVCITVVGCATTQTVRHSSEKSTGLTNAEAPGKADAIVADAEPILSQFLTAKHWAAVRNLTGVARAIFITPSGGQAGFMLGGQWGRGILLVRHGQKWSDPVFIKIGALQVGFLAGAQLVDAAGAILSKDALDLALAGKPRFSGSGDLTVGAGLSGKVAGGLSGIEVLFVSTNKGVYFGGSFEGLRLSVDDRLNREAYGDDFDLDRIVSSTGGRYPPANRIRGMLEKAAYQAVWGED